MPRREFMRVGTLALGGMTLSDLLAYRAAAGVSDPETSVILFWMWGGPSQLETYDMKPDAPSEYRGPFNPISSKVPGMDLVEHFPLQAKIADRFSIVRTLHHGMSAHNDGSITVLTGKEPQAPDPTSTNKSSHPDFGMIASYVRGPRSDGLPQYIGVHRAPFMTAPNYLGLSYKAFDSGDPSVKGFAPKNLTLAAGIDERRLDDRKSLVTQFDRYRRDLDLAGSMGGTEDFRQAAFNMLTSNKVADAFDLSKEDDTLRDRYGRHRWGQNCLLARRLAEAGSAVINVDATAPSNKSEYFSWDDHAGPFHLVHANLERFPQYDQAITALIEDLHERGLDRKVLVVACGEFGRTPRLTRRATFPGKKGGPWLGRDHWPNAFSALIAGGGLRMGQVVGSTNSKAEHPLHDPVTPQDLMATIYRHLGIDVTRGLVNFSGRPIPILYDGQPISQLV
ncbi:MAG: DUF1501 domain-containing protein [Planctomycetaceae bacterium]|jgi:hypothetical protein|nr:DUF1501 domain-containing protein [Planctomycetaceae bacterium]MBT6487354.1 DUF1501 domain-containing protein [Planctomycetaceae bacterium]MBT6493068.1 DUF1501 domain-containing protein [Planctomycetaceae bacterium]